MSNSWCDHTGSSRDVIMMTQAQVDVISTQHAHTNVQMLEMELCLLVYVCTYKYVLIIRPYTMRLGNLHI